MRNLELPGRSPVIAQNGVAATSHYLATETAVTVLREGGNAMDAAIAACAVQCVVEPESTGIGGDCFCLYTPKGASAPIAFNGSGRAPSAATPEWYAQEGITRIERQSAHAVTIPGAVDAWHQLLRDHGTLPMAKVLAPAIGFARDGYPVGARVSADFAFNVGILKDCPNATRVFLPGGAPIPMGEVHRQPELAATLQAIGDHGRDAFYTGAVAQDIVDYLQSRGGLHTMEDFATAAGDYVQPIVAQYQGLDVFQCPPNGQGVIALMLLKLIERFPPAGDTPINVQRIHQEIEAGRLCYHQRNAWLADPAQAEVPVDWLLSDANIDALFQSINPDAANIDLPDFQPPDHRNTVYITVVDKDRMAVLVASLQPLADRRGKTMVIVDPTVDDARAVIDDLTGGRGADDVVVSVPVAPVMADAGRLMAGDGMQDSIKYSREVIADLQKTEDFKEGVTAFVEKRAPNWVNK